MVCIPGASLAFPSSPKERWPTPALARLPQAHSRLSELPRCQGKRPTWAQHDPPVISFGVGWECGFIFFLQGSWLRSLSLVSLSKQLWTHHKY